MSFADEEIGKVHKETNIKKENPVKFIETFLFQYFNPKGVSVAIIVVSTNVELGENYINYATQVVLLAFLFHYFCGDVALLQNIHLQK